MSLVPDYKDSDSESEESNGDNSSEDSDEEEKVETKPEGGTRPCKELLPSASTMLFEKAQDVHVFRNPFIENEIKREKLLEKHKKMVSTDVKNVLTINGKKICFNFRQNGKCKFGSNCQYAHDSDLQQETSPKTNPPMTNQTKQKGLKRRGPADSLIPSKKSIKIYKNTKTTH